MSIREKRVSAVVAVAAVLVFTFAFTEVRSQRVAAQRNADILEVGMGGMPPGKTFQIAFVTRAATAFGTMVEGKAESLQDKRPGALLGDWVENVVSQQPDPSDPTGQRMFTGIEDTLYTKKGNLYWEGLALLAPAIDGVMASTSTEMGTFGTATISGGTGKYFGATGTATLTGRVSICLPGTEFCAQTDNPQIPPGLGLRFEYHWILRGEVPGRGGDGDDDDDDM